MKKLVFSIFALIVLSNFTSCSSVTEVNGTWKKPATVAQKYNKIIVIVIHQDIVKRSAFEKSIVNSLTANGINAVSGVNVIPQGMLDADNDKKLDPDAKEKLVAFLKQQNIDGAMTITLEDVKKSTSYVPGNNFYTPGVGMYGFYGYYGAAWNNFYDPGYYVTTTNVFLTTNFYNVASEQLLWSAQSQTIDPQSLKDFASSYGPTIVNQFLESGVIRK